jgi:hypothetical protein
MPKSGKSSKTRESRRSNACICSVFTVNAYITHDIKLQVLYHRGVKRTTADAWSAAVVKLYYSLPSGSFSRLPEGSPKAYCSAFFL